MRRVAFACTLAGYDNDSTGSRCILPRPQYHEIPAQRHKEVELGQGNGGGRDLDLPFNLNQALSALEKHERRSLGVLPRPL